MRLPIVLRVLSLISFIVSLSMIFPILWSLADGTSDLKAFLMSLSFGVMLSLALFALGKPDRGRYDELGIREAFAVVCFSWVIAGAIGALPYSLSGALPSYTDAFFETISGFTTTGATVLTDIEGAPRGILFWRALTHWLGGMGIVVLSLAVLPFLGVGGMELYKAEVPGPTPEKLTPRVQQTAMLLWGVYLLLTVAETVFLMFGGMSFFDAVTHSFSTIATGGFSTKNSSIAYFNSVYIEWVITFFMFISGMNFSLHFLMLTGHFKKALSDDELRYYAGIAFFSSAIIALFLVSGGIMGIGTAIRTAAFQVVSVMTTTGFITSDYQIWPAVTKFLLLILIALGSSAGSTGGGIKVMRLLVLVRQIKAEIMSLLHPFAVITTRVNGQVVSRKALSSVTAFFILYIIVMIGATLIVAAFGHPKLDVLTSLSGVVTCLSNVGPGLNALGPVENFAWLPAGVKWVLSFCMLAGRLELFAVILLFFPAAWTR